MSGREKAAVDGGDQAALVRACATRTLAADGVKVEWRDDWVSSSSTDATRRGRRGGLLTPIGRGAGTVAKAVWKRATNDFPFGHLAAKGILEPSTGRYMIDFGSFAQIHDGLESFGGRSGRPLATLSPFSTTGRSADMLWLLRVLVGTTDASAQGTDVLHGSTCSRLSVHVDLAAASEAVAEGLRSPRVDRFEQLRALPGTVWIDAQHIRRVQFTDPESRALSLELWDYGIRTDDFDWSRLPTFRSPQEAASYAGQSESWHHKLRSRVGALVTLRRRGISARALSARARSMRKSGET